MHFLLDAADQCKQRGCGRNAELAAIRRNQRARAVMVVLDHAETGRGQAKRVEHFPAHAHMAQAAIDQEGVRQGRKLLVPIHIALHAAGEHLAHGSIVVLPVCRTGDLKLAVFALFGLSLDKHNHRADRILSGEVGDVVCLEPQRQSGHTGHVLQQLERLVPPLGLLFAPLDFLARVFFRKAGQHAALAALRHSQLDLAFGDRAQVLRDRVLLLQLVRQQYGFGHRTALRVILLDERGKHLRWIAFEHMEQAVLLILQGAARIVKHAHAGARLPLYERYHVDIRKRARHHMLPRAQPLHGAQAVAQQGCALKLQFLGSLVHLFGQFLFQLFRIALEQGDRLIDQRVVFCRADLARTRCTAPPEVLVQAGPILADVAREHARAGFEVQRLADRVDRAARGHAARVRPKVARSIVPRLGDNGERRVGRIRVQPDIGIALVVLEQDVVFGLVFFNHRVLKHERFELGFGHNDIEIIDMADQLARFGAQAFRRLKIVGNAVAQQLGLADVDHLAGLVLVQVYARLHGQTAHALFQLFSCRGDRLLLPGDK